MKTFRSFIIYLSASSLSILLQSCPKPLDVKTINPDAFVGGTYEWDSTITPTRKLTPAAVGYTQQFQNTLRQYNGVIPATYFYKNDTLVRRALTVSGDSAFVENAQLETVLVQYSNPVGYIFFRLLDDRSVEISNFLPSYSTSADTVHNYYHLKEGNFKLYPN